MKEFIQILLTFNLRKILLEPTKNSWLQAFRYLFVGGIATIADWGTLFALTHFGLNKYIGTFIAFCVGLAVNFALSKQFVFAASKVRISKSREIMAYALVGVVGLILTEILVWVLTDILPMHLMIAKIIATCLTLVWNFIGRKMLYRT